MAFNFNFNFKTVGTGKNRLASFKGLDDIAIKYADYATEAAARSLITFGCRINRVYTDSVEDFYGHDTKLGNVARAYVDLDGIGLEAGRRKASHKFVTTPWSKNEEGDYKRLGRRGQAGGIVGLRNNTLKLYIGFAGEKGLNNEVAYQREFGITGGGIRFINSP